MRFKSGLLWLALLAVLACGVLGLAALPSVAARSSSCGPAKGTTLVRGRRVRIYSLTPAPEPHRYFGNEPIFACLVSTGRSWQLNGRLKPPLPKFNGFGFGVVSFEPLAIRAPWVAYPETFPSVDTAVLTVTAKDLRTGATSYCLVEGWGAPHPGPRLDGIVLKRNGHRAWVGKGGPFSHYKKKVAVCPSAALELRSTEIESGEGIDLHSLKLHGSRLAWTNSGMTEVATLH